MSGPSFSYPLRPWRLMRCDAGYLSPAYKEAHGKNHRGIDLNLVSGGDTDFGYPISNCVPGTVIHAGVFGSWGGIVVVRADEWVRRLFMDAFERPIASLEFQYAHLHHIHAAIGDAFNAGDVVGSMGKGTFGQYLAHLHIEVRTSEFAPDRPQEASEDDRDFIAARTLDPQLVFKRLPFSDHPNTLAQKEYWTPTRILGVEHAGEEHAVVRPVGDKLYIRGV